VRVLKTPEKLILGAAATLLVVGGALAVAQPGDLGSDQADRAAEETTTTSSPATSTTVSTSTTTSTTAPGPATTATTEAPGDAVAPTTTTTTIAGSGLGQSGAPSGGTDGIANTGGESMLGAGLAVGALGLLLRRFRRPAS
jgi:hypothetical protein